MKTILRVLIAGIVIAAAPVSATNLISNGDLSTGNLSGWTTTGNVSLASTPFFGFNSPSWGRYFVAFNTGNSPANGTLAQTIATNAGTAYSLTFNYGVNWYDAGVGSLGQSIIASVVDSTTHNVLATTTIFSHSTALVTSALNFTASSNGSIVRFTDVASNNSYNVDGGIDHISVTAAAVPEPASWAMMFAGFGAIGFVMRHRAKVSTTVAFA